jgi:diguanylate cyclase (GGDEF)-like protein
MNTPLPPVVNIKWESIFNSVNLGLILVDSQGTVLLWNDWIARHSGIHSDAAVSHLFTSIFPNPLPSTFVSAVNSALKNGLPLVMSNALHKSPLPLFSQTAMGISTEKMQQSITITPVKFDDSNDFCLIQVVDSSTSIKREKILRLHSESHKKDASTDSLTDIYNRRFFDEHFKLELNRAKRLLTPMSLVMLDIDFFKNYNDYYGHPTGDLALIAVANCIKTMMQRGSDMVARYGGEEFIMVLPNFSPEKAQHFALMILNAIDQLQIPHRKSNISDHITVSIGVSTYTPEINCDNITLLNAADLALYKPKQNGRNQLCYLEAKSELLASPPP